MEMKSYHVVGMIVGLLILGSSFLLIGTKFWFFSIGVGVLVLVSPFVFSIIHDNNVEAEKEEMFLEFSRNLVESVKTGTPISKSIINVKDKSYGVLSNNIKKLANQISMGIPFHKALKTFSDDINNETISRSLTLWGQAEKSGGEIGQILDSVTEAVSMSDRLKKERKAAISTLIVQGYIIFFVFIAIILVMEFQILPMVSGISGINGSLGSAGQSLGIGFLGGGGAPINQQAIANSFLYLLLIQGFFSGLTIGKLSSGTIKTGIKHSFALMLFAFLISTGANILFGTA